MKISLLQQIKIGMSSSFKNNLKYLFVAAPYFT